MNKTLSTVALAIFTFSAFAQKSGSEPLKYEANEYDLKKVDRPYAYKSTGQQFRERMDAFWKVANAQAKPFVSKAEYIQYRNSMWQLSYADAKIAKRLENFVAAINAASDEHLSRDGYRNKIYHMAFPVSVAINEGWGSDVVDVVLTDSWRDLDNYISVLEKDDKSLSKVSMLLSALYENDLRISQENSKTCPYNVVVDKPLQKDRIDVYFCDVRMADMIRNLDLYPQDRQLAGPIKNYTTLKEQSSNLLHFLENSRADAANNISYVKIYPKSASSVAKVDLNENTEWYLYAFRNGSLYYSYMALPCSPSNTCTIKEQMLTAEEKQLNEVAPQ